MPFEEPELAAITVAGDQNGQARQARMIRTSKSLI
jgi:hypothetical protein